MVSFKKKKLRCCFHVGILIDFLMWLLHFHTLHHSHLDRDRFSCGISTAEWSSDMRAALLIHSPKQILSVWVNFLRVIKEGKRPNICCWIPNICWPFKAAKQSIIFPLFLAAKIEHVEMCQTPIYFTLWLKWEGLQTYCHVLERQIQTSV